MVEISGLRILFTGDLGEEGEQELLEAGTDLRAAVLKVGHHGSRFSSGEDFLEAVSPGICCDLLCGGQPVRPPGAGNGSKGWRRAGCRIFYTMKSGAVTLYPVNGKKGWKLEQKFDRIERGDSYEHS